MQSLFIKFILFANLPSACVYFVESSSELVICAEKSGELKSWKATLKLKLQFTE